MLSCDQHDYLEVACVYRFELEVTTTDGQSYVGLANDVRYENKTQCLVLESGSEQHTVAIAQITSLVARTDNPYFQRVEVGF
ncbi:Rho-binding antiterminator (plasmid) [Pseudoalteromonas xiamenensis]|uniref:Rho-binding antiterminator n=1 Tax=Pseudoalteromonas xiamenensis TaxID=882626 RepID=UPI0027E5BA42|nr:Rho-binding antiterminator [Pseudoalteromonas xiamenensis]WMN62002.1 Rho-binding antiterminator [Pseudoalteromonas xiamenensis]